MASKKQKVFEYNGKTSILEYSKVISGVPSSAVEGIDYINISKQSITTLGKMLMPSYTAKKPFDMPFGGCISIYSAWAYVVRSSYPENLLTKRKLDAQDYKNISLPDLKVDNFWSIIAYAYVMRIKADKGLYEAIAALPKDIMFTSFDGHAKKDLFGSKVTTTLVNAKMGYVVAIMRHIKTLIDENKFKGKHIKLFIDNTKHQKDKSIWSGSSVNVVEDTEETNTPIDVVAAVLNEVTTEQHKLCYEDSYVLEIPNAVQTNFGG